MWGVGFASGKDMSRGEGSSRGKGVYRLEGSSSEESWARVGSAAPVRWEGGHLVGRGTLGV